MKRFALGGEMSDLGQVSEVTGSVASRSAKKVLSCGPRCLEIIASRCGLRADGVRLAELAGACERGASAAGLMRAAETAGLECELAWWSLDKLAGSAGEVGGRAILHLEIGQGHYAVFEGLEDDGFVLTDPWNERERAWKASREELARKWRGLILVMRGGTT